MYFPYFRGRQFELIALREYATQKGDNNNILPIIEPVKKSYNSLKIAIKQFKESSLRFSMILNPQVGELAGASGSFIQELEEELSDANWYPAFVVTNNIEEINGTIKSGEYLSNVILICSKMADTGADDFLELAQKDCVEYIVTEENKSLKRSLKGTGKKIILLSDCFESQQRNKDYLHMPEEKFTEEHIFFDDDGYAGFADFTTLSSEFTEGGSTPFAVAIHLTYQKENKEIWIRHFTSESNEDRANIQGKFAEATRKAVNFLDEKDLQEVISYWDHLKDSLKWERRFILERDNLIDFGWDKYFAETISLSEDNIFYRARIHFDENTDTYNLEQMGSPPREKSSEGRANPLGIPYLYLSKDLKTTFYETKVLLHDEVSIGKFAINKGESLNLVDFTEIPSAFLGMGDLENYCRKTLLKKRIGKDLSKPIRRYDSKIEYVPTQFICEFLRYVIGADGIIFNSSLNPEGQNVVLFDDKLVECIEVEQYAVSGMDIAFEPLSEFRSNFGRNSV